MQWNKEGYPTEKKEVLVHLLSSQRGVPNSIVVGYMRYAAGDKKSPLWITPGCNGHIIEWCDCLEDKFKWPPNMDL